jgi:dTDP-4-amino-4,6-dideoxygalactose transaminase
MQIPFVDLRIQYDHIRQEIDAAIDEILNTATFVGGKPVKDFESAFAAAYGVKYVIGVGNGTDAIYIVLKMLGITQGDEVITTATSWISAAETISQTGARPVFVDVDPHTVTIDPALIEAKISKRTKAIIPVHLYGQMAHINQIAELCRKYKLYLIEDCAQSHFSAEKGVLAGKTGIAGTFSFYPGKNLGAYGDAGCIITNDDYLASRFRMYANHGALVKHEHQIEGINSRLDSIQAAILSVKLKYIKNWTAKRISNAVHYSEQLKGIEQIRIPQVRDNTIHTFHLYVIQARDRDNLKQHLERQGIQTAIHYPTALPNLPAYAHLAHSPSDFPVATRLQNEILSLPMFPELETEQIDFVCEKIREFYN